MTADELIPKILDGSILIMLLVFIFIILLMLFLKRYSGIKTKKQIRRLAEKEIELTPPEFFELRKQCRKTEKTAGVYILYNRTKNMYYVGQAHDLLQRVNNHLTGHGNGDVYADYKYGNQFTVKMIPLIGSGCKTLNELERKAIYTYDGYSKGYNKTKGNKG